MNDSSCFGNTKRFHFKLISRQSQSSYSLCLGNLCINDGVKWRRHLFIEFTDKTFLHTEFWSVTTKILENVASPS